MVTKPRAPLFDGLGGALCLDFANSVDRTAGGPWIERLQTYADLCTWSEEAAALPADRLRRLARLARSRPAEAESALARARELREALFRVFDAIAHGEQPALADLGRVNGALARALTHARVERAGDGFEWSWEPAPEDLDAPQWPIARSAAELLVSPDRALIKECASSTCLWLFVDRTRNHQRRWCEMKTCGNRAKVREHRRRHAADQRPPRATPAR